MTENRSRRGGRKWGLILGAAVLGFIGGVLAAIVLNDLVAGFRPEALRVIAPLSLPAGAIVGALVTGILAHRRLSLSG